MINRLGCMAFMTARRMKSTAWSRKFQHLAEGQRGAAVSHQEAEEVGRANAEGLWVVEYPKRDSATRMAHGYK